MAVFQTTLNYNHWAGYSIGFGAICAEAIYCGGPLFGLGLMDESSGIFDIMYLLFIPILVFLGILSLVNRKKGIPTDDAVPHLQQPPQPKRKSYFAYMVYGFLLCISNPMTLIFWTQATITLQKQEVINQDPAVLTAFFLGVPPGTFALYAVFVLLALKSRKKMKPVWRERMNALIGIIFIVIAVYLLISYLFKHGYF
ncbi:MAG TPA: hypothetical protein ENJ82_10560 [Bacteroidetes bacterium]|nr:hypothetical protein [Bacteroidota bacterium]